MTNSDLNINNNDLNTNSNQLTVELPWQLADQLGVDDGKSSHIILTMPTEVSGDVAWRSTSLVEGWFIEQGADVAFRTLWVAFEPTHDGYHRLCAWKWVLN